MIKVELEFHSVDEKLPECEFRAGAEEFIFLFSYHNEYGIADTMYSNGKFEDPILIGIGSDDKWIKELPDESKYRYHEGVTHWAYKPKELISND